MICFKQNESMKRALLVGVGLIAVLLGGCGETQREKLQRTAANMHEIGKAMQSYAIENHGVMPQKIGQITDYLPQEMFVNPRTGVNPGYLILHAGKRRNRMQGSEVILVELLDGQPNPKGLGAKMDGTVGMDPSIEAAIIQFKIEQAKEAELPPSKHDATRDTKTK